MEALKNFKEFPLKNFHCLSGGKKQNYTTNRPFRPSFGNFRKYFEILAGVSSLEFFVLLFQDKRTKNKKPIANSQSYRRQRF